MGEKRIAKRRHRAVKPPFSMYGSKQRMLPRLLSFTRMVKHELYVEVFGGTGALLLAKPRSRIEVYNDLSSGFVDMFRVIRDEEKFKEFQRLVEYTPYAKEEWEAMRNWKELPRGSVERAVAFFVFMSLSFKAGYASAFSRPKGRGSNSTMVYAHAVDRLSLIHNRFRGTVIENESFEKLIPRYDSKDALFYCDPPYIPETRSGSKANAYECEMISKQHKTLVRLLNKCVGKIILSGYAHPLYDEHLHGFTRYDFQHTSSIPGKSKSRFKSLGGKRTESIWINF